MTDHAGLQGGFQKLPPMGNGGAYARNLGGSYPYLNPFFSYTTCASSTASLLIIIKKYFA
jgi:hypothetical protein